uniref:Riboflavin transporter n=1 Tax=Cyprinus carpio TaxID=7962 RepID=A0A8C1SPI3_CYPCA
MSLFTHVFACLFGIGSWVAINGMWVELPLIVPSIPEGWYLPSYLTIIIQMANIGPLFITLMHRFRPGVLDERPVIYTIVTVGVVATFLLLPAVCGGLHLVRHLSSLHDASAASVPHHLLHWRGSKRSELQAHYQRANFSTQGFFLFLSAMMMVCLGAFLLLNFHPAVAQEHKSKGYVDDSQRVEKIDMSQAPNNENPEQTPMLDFPEGTVIKQHSAFGKGTYILAWVNALTNAVLPSVQAYSCLPYGNQAYHLAATLSSVANPVACFIAMFVPIRTLVLMGFLTVTGTGFGAYIMAMAALSPCPLLINHDLGAALIVLTWVIFVLTLSYVKVIIGVILRDEGHSALVWCGAVVQLGSMLGALSMFPLVSVYRLFQSGDPCNTKCPK